MKNLDTSLKPSSTKLMKLSTLKANPTNPRIIKDEKFQKLVKSIEEFPEMLEARPIVVNPEMVVIGGNMRFKACKAAGLKEAPVYMATWGETKDREFIIKDNVSSGENDFDILANEWDAEELNEWGLDVWTGEPEETEGLTDPDDVPEVPEEAKTKLGDLYILGEHRLLCGDSTKAEDVEKLMNGEKADMVFTDPPYGVDYEGGSKKRDGLISDERNTTIYQDIVPIITKYCDGACYVWYADKNPLGLYESVIKHGEIHSVLIWAKNNSTFNMNIHYKSKHEPCLYWKPKGATLKWKGSNTEETVWNIDRDSANKLHPTQKPVILSERAINNHDAKIVLDLFLGSGSTLIGAEKTGRKCYGMELDPKYCDVIVKRWEDFTGKKASKQ
jgi:DNA modification methylase